MADNVTYPIAGGTVARTKDLGSGVQLQGALILDSADGEVFGTKTQAKSAATDTTSVSAMQVLKQLSDYLKAQTRLIVASASQFTRPANTTAYAANDAVSNNATAGSVTPLSFTVSDTNDEPVSIERARITASDTGFAAGIPMRLYLFNASPTVGAGDNAAWSQARANFVGSMTGTFRQFSNGGVCILAPEEGQRIITTPTSGAATLFGLLQVLAAVTPQNASTWDVTIEALQGRA